MADLEAKLAALRIKRDDELAAVRTKYEAAEKKLIESGGTADVSVAPAKKKAGGGVRVPTSTGGAGTRPKLAADKEEKKHARGGPNECLTCNGKFVKGTLAVGLAKCKDCGCATGKPNVKYCSRCYIKHDICMRCGVKLLAAGAE